MRSSVNVSYIFAPRRSRSRQSTGGSVKSNRSSRSAGSRQPLQGPLFAEQDACPPGVDAVRWNTQVAAGKSVGILENMGWRKMSIERSSVYGAALALPQLARTSGWSLSFTGLCIRSYVLLLTNLLLQGWLLYMVSKSERLLDKLGGQPRLCDFGADLRNCPDGPNCIGPGGTTFALNRSRGWSQWTLSRFSQAALLNIFPEMSDVIHEKVDPGEYGVEDYYLRICSIYVFVLGLFGDLHNTFEMCNLLYWLPTEPMPWMTYIVPDLTKKMQRDSSWSELNNLKFSISGMPRVWKLINVLFVCIPKVYIWLLTIDVGVFFLMETARIEDMITNSVALAFILSIDELIFDSLFPTMAKYIMDAFEDFVPTDEQESTFWSADALEVHRVDKNWSRFNFKFYARAFPQRLFYVAAITLFFITKYYVESCRRRPDGSLVAKDVFLPSSPYLSLMTFLNGPVPGWAPVDTDGEAVWQMTYPEGV